MPHARHLIAACAAGTLLLLLPAIASAATFDGRKWPGRTITVHNATNETKSFNLAVAAWNNTGARIRFRKVRSARRANVVVKYSNKLPACGLGLGTVGYVGPGRQGTVLIRRSPAPSSGQACAWPGQALVITHELGHVLGFGHELRQCSLMNTAQSEGIGPQRCTPSATSQATIYAGRDYIGRWRCQLIETLDARRLVRRYGGRVKPRPASPWCDVYPPIAPPTPLTATDESTGIPMVRVELRRPANPAQPAFIVKYPNYQLQSLRNRYTIYRSAGECLKSWGPDPYAPPAGSALVTSGVWSVEAGGTQLIDDTGLSALGGSAVPIAGTLCYRAWAWDSAGRPSRLAASATLTI